MVLAGYFKRVAAGHGVVGNQDGDLIDVATEHLLKGDGGAGLLPGVARCAECFGLLIDGADAE